MPTIHQSLQATTVADRSLAQTLGQGNDANALKITNLHDPAGPQDADTKAARDAATAVLVPQGGPLTEALDADGQGITNALLGGAELSSDLNAGAQKIVNLHDPAGGQDAATKAYADSLVAVTLVGTPGGQSRAGASYQVVATTTNATPVTVDTGYKPADGHAAHVDGNYSITDRTAHKARAKGISVAVRNFSGLVVAGSVPPGGISVGDSLTGGSTPAQPEVSFGVSGGGTLTVTFTPAASYVGTLDWLVTLSVDEN